MVCGRGVAGAVGEASLRADVLSAQPPWPAGADVRHLVMVYRSPETDPFVIPILQARTLRLTGSETSATDPNLNYASPLSFQDLSFFLAFLEREEMDRVPLKRPPLKCMLSELKCNAKAGWAKARMVE